MGEFADELRASIEEAARNITEALAAGDDYGAEVYRERLYALKRVAQRHGIQPPPARNLPTAATPVRTSVKWLLNQPTAVRRSERWRMGRSGSAPPCVAKDVRQTRWPAWRATPRRHGREGRTADTSGRRLPVRHRIHEAFDHSRSPPAETGSRRLLSTFPSNTAAPTR